VTHKEENDYNDSLIKNNKPIMDIDVSLDEKKRSVLLKAAKEKSTM